jgi:hypothetical protein
MLLLASSALITAGIVVIAGLVLGTGSAKMAPAQWGRPVLVLLVVEIAVVAAFVNDVFVRFGPRFRGEPVFFGETPLGYGPEGAVPNPASKLGVTEKLFFIYPLAAAVLAAMIVLW